MGNLSFKVERNIATISFDERGNTIELNRIMWGANPAKLDLRRWYQGKAHGGFTLSDDEARKLLEALKGYFDEKGGDKE